MLPMLGHQLGREGQKSNAHQEQEIEPEQSKIGADDMAEEAVMGDPEEANHQEAGDEAEKLWPEPEHHLREVDGRLVGRDGRQLELQGEQGNGDGKDAVTEGLNPACSGSPFHPIAVLAPHPEHFH